MKGFWKEACSGIQGLGSKGSSYKFWAVLIPAPPFVRPQDADCHGSNNETCASQATKNTEMLWGFGSNAHLACPVNPEPLA